MPRAGNIVIGAGGLPWGLKFISIYFVGVVFNIRVVSSLSLVGVIRLFYLPTLIDPSHELLAASLGKSVCEGALLFFELCIPEYCSFMFEWFLFKKFCNLLTV